MSVDEIALATRGAHLFFLSALYGALILVEWVVAVRLNLPMQGHRLCSMRLNWFTDLPPHVCGCHQRLIARMI